MRMTSAIAKQTPGLSAAAADANLLAGARVAPATALLLVLSFVVLVSLPAAVQWALRPEGEFTRLKELLKALPTLPQPVVLATWADDLARESVAASWARGYYQLALAVALRQGSAKVVVGRDGWLFLAKDLSLLTGTVISGEAPRAGASDPENADSVTVIRAYDELLRARGIHLVVLPVPPATVLYPEKIWPGYPTSAGPAWAPDYSAWAGRIRQAGVDLLDVTDDLWRAKNGPVPVWLKNDTHWAPYGVELTAARVAQHIRPLLGSVPNVRYTTRKARHEARGQLTSMLDVVPSAFFRPEWYDVTQVWQNEALAAGDNDSAVLLLGDSYATIYSGDSANDAAGGDLGRQVMLRLGADIQVIAHRGNDPSRMRWRLGFHPGCLDSKKVFVWEFAARFLRDPQAWKLVVLPLSPATP